MPKLPNNLEKLAIVKALRGQDAGPQVVEYDQFIAEQVRTTGRAVQSADIASSLLTLAAGWVLFVLLASVAEHWLTEHGFRPATRYGLFTVAVSATCWHLWSSLWPALTGRINPLFAAQAMETNAPSLKNSLVNLLTLGRGRRVSPTILALLEQQAAEGIAASPEHAVVDRSRLVRMAGALVTLLGLLLGYWLLSSKDPLTTAARVAAPWAKIAPPSRVQITQVAPGDVQLVEGQTLQIEASITGMSRDEHAHVEVSSRDGQHVGQRFPLLWDAERGSHRLTLGTSKSASKEWISGENLYCIVAGDGRSLYYRADVLPAPTLAVTQVEYAFPAYTGLLAYTDTTAADLRGIEGTRVTLHAESNAEIESAAIDFEADGSYDLPMQIDDSARTATVSFPLALRPDRITPKHTSYVLRLKTRGGLVNSQPAKHAISVYPDYPPEIQFVTPEQQELSVGLNQTVVIAGEARDPDFALSDMRLYGEAAGQRVLNKRLIERPVRGLHAAEFRFTPSQHGLQVGDTVEYWLEASDNRQPNRQTAATHRQRFRITSPGPRDAQGDQLADAQAQEDPSQNQAGKTGQQNGEQQGKDQGDQTGEQQGSTGQGEQQGETGEQGEQGETDDNQPGDNQQAGDSGGLGTNEQGGAEAEQSQASGGAGESQGEQQNSRGSGQSSDSNQAGGQPGSESQQSSGGSQSNDSATRQSGKNNENAPASQKDSTPLESDGSEDGEAFDRILDHLDNEQNRSNASDPRPGDPKSNPDASTGQGSETSRDATGPSIPQSDSSNANSESNTGEQPSPSGNPTPPSTEGQPEDSTAADQPESPNQSPDQSPSQGSEQGQADPSASQSRQESSSQGLQSSDRSGKGAEGGGQQTPREGSGSSGQNEAAESGAGQAQPQGAGEAGNRPGQDQLADQPTGSQGQPQGNAAGEGRESGEQENNSSQQAGDNSAADPSAGPGQPGQQAQGNSAEQANPAAGDAASEQSSSPSEMSQQPSDPQQRDRSQATPPGQTQPSRGSNAQSGAGGDFGQDQANLEYAKQRMELVLDRLSDQLDKQQVDERLLDQLGWSEAELKQFVQRWKQRQQAAELATENDGSQTQLDRALRSLGLTPNRQAGETTRNRDRLQNQSTGRSSNAPAKYRRRMQQYNQGVSGAGQ